MELRSWVSTCPLPQSPVPEPFPCSHHNLGNCHSLIAGGRAPFCGHVSQLSVDRAQGWTYKPGYGSGYSASNQKMGLN